MSHGLADKVEGHRAGLRWFENEAEEDVRDLEQMMDVKSLSQVIQALATICNSRAVRLRGNWRGNWRNPSAAKKYQLDAYLLTALAKRICN